MNKMTLMYGAVLAVGAFLLQWLDYKHSARLFATEIYIVLIALAFMVLGLWLGFRLTSTPVSASGTNGVDRDRESGSSGLSPRELEVLHLIAAGLTNQEIADQLFVSLNTIKTHVTNLYGKLEVSRRTQAVAKAKALRLVS